MTSSSQLTDLTRWVTSSLRSDMECMFLKYKRICQVSKVETRFFFQEMLCSKVGWSFLPAIGYFRMVYSKRDAVVFFLFCKVLLLKKLYCYTVDIYSVFILISRFHFCDLFFMFLCFVKKKQNQCCRPFLFVNFSHECRRHGLNFIYPHGVCFVVQKRRHTFNHRK